jgi:hypothetical protein
MPSESCNTSRFVLPNRPSFTGKGTDATAYAWFCWNNFRPPPGRLYVLDSTPLKDRRAK